MSLRWEAGEGRGEICSVRIVRSWVVFDEYMATGEQGYDEVRMGVIGGLSVMWCMGEYK